MTLGEARRLSTCTVYLLEDAISDSDGDTAVSILYPRRRFSRRQSPVTAPRSTWTRAIFLKLFRNFLMCLHVFRSFRTCSDLFGPVRMRSDAFTFVWMRLGAFGRCSKISIFLVRNGPKTVRIDPKNLGGSRYSRVQALRAAITSQN